MYDIAESTDLCHDLIWRVFDRVSKSVIVLTQQQWQLDPICLLETLLAIRSHSWMKTHRRNPQDLPMEPYPTTIPRVTMRWHDHTQTCQYKPASLLPEHQVFNVPTHTIRILQTIQILLSLLIILEIILGDPLTLWPLLLAKRHPHIRNGRSPTHLSCRAHRYNSLMSRGTHLDTIEFSMLMTQIKCTELQMVTGGWRDMPAVSRTAMDVKRPSQHQDTLHVIQKSILLRRPSIARFLAVSKNFVLFHDQVNIWHFRHYNVSTAFKLW
jgi:hypothetical protein